MLIPSLLAAAMLSGPAGPGTQAVDPVPDPLPSTIVEGDSYFRLPSRPRLVGERPSALPGLYASFLALQIGDTALTAYGLNHGYREVNPLLGGGFGTSIGTLVPLKIGTSALAIWAVERMWKRGHRTAAVLTIVGANVLGVAVLSRNISVLRTGQ